MRSLRTLAAASLVALALVARPAEAQFSLGLGGGFTSPSGDLKDAQDGGWNVLGTLQAGLPLLPIAVRGDLQYNSFGGKRFGAFQTDDARVISATVNAVWNIIPLGPVKPYVIGGGGWYSTRLDASDPGNTFSSDTRKFGYNFGGGIKVGLLGLSGFVEARVHQVSGGIDVGGNRSTARYIPITAGIFF
jgi:hypothetical protein